MLEGEDEEDDDEDERIGGLPVCTKNQFSFKLNILLIITYFNRNNNINTIYYISFVNNLYVNIMIV